MQNQNKVKLIGVFASLSVALGILESFIALPLPGLRIGLANVGIMLAIYLLDTSSALKVAFIKVLIVPLLTGNLIVKFSISAPATFASALSMILYKKITGKYSSPLSTGALGGIVHISIQFFMAVTLYIKNGSVYKMLPYMAGLSVATGIITGYITYKLSERIKIQLTKVENYVPDNNTR